MSDSKRQFRTTLAAALLTVIVLGIPIIVTLTVALATGSDTNAIRRAGDQADRNLAVQSCSTEYARTYAFWEAEHNRLFALILEDAFAERAPSRRLLTDFRVAGENESEVNRRGLGVVALAREEAAAAEDHAAEQNGDYHSAPPFACPPLPDRLRVEPLDPTDPEPPG